MVYKKFKRIFKKQQRRARSYTRSALNLAKQVNFMKGMINAERKSFTSVVNFNVTSTGAVFCLNQIAQGLDIDARNGNSILCKYITGKLTIQMSPSATSTFARIIFFKDTSNQGVNPTVADILQNASVRSLTNPDNTDRFLILQDMLVNMSISGQQGYAKKIYLKINDHLKYSGTTAADFNKNAIYVLYISTEATNVPVIASYLRLTYYDN